MLLSSPAGKETLLSWWVMICPHLFVPLSARGWTTPAASVTPLGTKPSALRKQLLAPNTAVNLLGSLGYPEHMKSSLHHVCRLPTQFQTKFMIAVLICKARHGPVPQHLKATCSSGLERTVLLWLDAPAGIRAKLIGEGGGPSPGINPRL